MQYDTRQIGIIQGTSFSFSLFLSLYKARQYLKIHSLSNARSFMCASRFRNEFKLANRPLFLLAAIYWNKRNEFLNVPSFLRIIYTMLYNVLVIFLRRHNRTLDVN